MAIDFRFWCRRSQLVCLSCKQSENGRTGKADFERRLALAEQEEKKVRAAPLLRVKFRTFEQTFYDYRIPLGVVLTVIGGFVEAVIYGLFS